MAVSATKFRYVYVPFFVLFCVVYLCFTWTRRAVTDDLPYPFLDPWDETGEKKNVGPVVGMHLGLVAWSVIASTLTVLFSRLKRFYSKKELMVM